MKITRTPVLVAVLVTFAVVAPAVGAGTSPDDRSGPHGIGSTDPGTVTPDDRAGTRGIGPSPVTLSPDDRLGPRGDTVARTPTPATIIVRPGGFDWADAGVGAAVAVGAALLAAGLLLVGRRRSVAHPV
jgi:hypothetical protein